MAMGINQIAGIGGGFIGLILGGLLAVVNWRAVFLVSVPFGLIGTVWAYLMLHEFATYQEHQKLDLLGNLLFAGGLTVLLIALTYGLMPYGTSPMGWGNPKVIGSILFGIILLIAFVFAERRATQPMFRLDLFRIRMFAINISGFLASTARAACSSC